MVVQLKSNKELNQDSKYVNISFIINLIKLRSSNSLPVKILREGQEETIYVNAESLSAKMLPALGINP